MKIVCKFNYKNGALGLNYKAGDVVEVDDALRLYLMTDAPGCFEAVQEKAPAKPKRNKAVRNPRAKK